MFLYFVEGLSPGRWHGRDILQLRLSLQGLEQACRGRADVLAGAARLREGMGARAHVDALYGQQPSEPLQNPGQACQGRADVLAGATRQGEGIRARVHVDAQHGQQPGEPLR